MNPFWAFFRYDEPSSPPRKNDQKLLTELQQLSTVPVYVRTHNLLTSKGNRPGSNLRWGFTDAYREDMAGNPIYNLTIVGSKVQRTISVLVHHYRLDGQFSNSFEKWKVMGGPQNVTTEQYQEFERTEQLQLFTSPEWKDSRDGKTMLQFDLPRQGVSFIQLSS